MATAANGWNARFFASTRGQVVVLLRQGYATVEELAQALDLTDNAVRAHLASLERDQLVEQQGVRRGVGKPSFTYVLTPTAEQLFPKAYGTVLHLLLDVLNEQLPPEVVSAALRDVGRRLAAQLETPPGDLTARVAGAVAMLGDLGGLAVVAEEHGELVIAGRSCPLAAAVDGHPETCLLAEALLTEIIGVPVRQVCDAAIPRCCFLIEREAGAA